MATNKYWMIPGASRPSKSAVSKAYVDNKFTTLSCNLNTKMDRIGGNFAGDIHMADKNITISRTPTNVHDVTNKEYVDTTVLATAKPVSDTELNSKLSKSGGTLTGPLDLGEHKITSRYVPINDFDFINKKFLDAGLAHRLNTDDMKIIENRLSLKLKT